MSGSLPQLQTFQLPDVGGVVNALQGLELNRMRSQQLQGAEQEKNALRRYLADPTVDLTSPDAARKLLEIAPTTGAATYQALLRGYADKRAAEASVRAAAASDRAAAASARQAQTALTENEIKSIELGQRLLIPVRDLPEAERPRAYATWLAGMERRIPGFSASAPREYSDAGYYALLSKASEIVAGQKPPEGFTLGPGQTRFDAAGQPIATADVRDTAREVRIRSIMETQNVPLQIAAGIVDGVLVPITDPVSGQTRMLNKANNTFLELTPAGAPAPAAPAPMATGPRVGVAPPAPAPMATGPRVGVAPPPNAMVAEPANAMLALPGAAAQPNVVQLPTFAAPSTRPQADYQKRVLDLMADLEKQRIESLRARTARREDAPTVAAEAGMTAEATARGQSVVRREDQPLRVQEAGQTAGAQTTGRLEAEEAAKRRQDVERLDFAIREVERLIRPGGLLQSSTGSGAGRLVDVAGAAVGMTSRASQAAAAIPPIADLALKMVPRFEGPQSENDRKSYEKAAGNLADSTQPNADRLAAAREVLRIMRARRDQFTFRGGEATPAASTETPAAAPRRPAPPQPGAVQDGYRFKGGDPANAQNWERL